MKQSSSLFRHIIVPVRVGQTYRKSQCILGLKSVFFQFCKQNKNKPQQNISNDDNKDSNVSISKNSHQMLQQDQKQQLIESEQQNKKYTVIPRNYNETIVPGLETRKYSDLSKLQSEIISTNKFDIMNPDIVPKAGASNSYVGINETLTEISLGNIKVKGQNEVFLSQVDPNNIPADLDIRFDSKKELKIVGRETKKQKISQQEDNSKNEGNKGSTEMQVQADTIQQKTVSEFMQQQFGAGVKGYQYHFTQKVRRWDIFLSILSVSLIIPILETLKQLNQCYKSTKEIQEERMKEVTQLKRRSFQRVLFQNKDFNKLV